MFLEKYQRILPKYPPVSILWPLRTKISIETYKWSNAEAIKINVSSKHRNGLMKCSASDFCNALHRRFQSEAAVDSARRILIEFRSCSHRPIKVMKNLMITEMKIATIAIIEIFIRISKSLPSRWSIRGRKLSTKPRVAFKSPSRSCGAEI